MECNCRENQSIGFNEEYDASYCTNCDIWLENACNDPDCYFCVDRPERPNEVGK